MLKLAVMSSVLMTLSFSIYAQEVNSSWDANTEADLAGYKIYYGTETGKYDVTVDVGNVTSAKISNLNTNTTYFFAVTAIDNSGNESNFSNEVSLFIPPPADTTPPQAPRNVTVVIGTSSSN